MDFISKVIEILRKYSLCNHCLGRLFAKIGYGLENFERGFSIKNVVYMILYEKLRNANENERHVVINDLIKLAESGYEPAIKFLKEKMNLDVNTKPCYICNNSIFNKVDSLIDKVIKHIKNSEIEFRTFYVGTRIPKEILKKELDISIEFNLETIESIKRELNRIIGKKLKNVLNVEFSLEKPDIVILVDPFKESVEIEIKPFYVYSRYRKLVRGISQVQLRLNVITSLQKELNKLSNYFLSNEVIIHAAGREDTDVRMLGLGRPLVLAFIQPKRRPKIEEIKKIFSEFSIDNFIQLDSNNVKNVLKSTIVKLKKDAEHHQKLYRVLAFLTQDVEFEKLKILEEYFRNRQITQYTPKRIKRKSPKKKRVRMVYEIRVRKIDSNLVEFLIRCQGGLYVKEFITGDEGRTTPSISDTLGIEVIPIEVDVLDVIEIPI